MLRKYGECYSCECPIMDGEEFYELEGEIWCVECAKDWFADHKRCVDIEGELADRWYADHKDRDEYLR